MQHAETHEFFHQIHHVHLHNYPISVITRIVNNVENGLLAEKENITNKSIATTTIQRKELKEKNLGHSTKFY